MPSPRFKERPQQWLMYIRLSPRFDASFRRASEWARILSREVAPQRRDAPDCFEERPQQWLLYIRLSPNFDAQVHGEQRTLDAKITQACCGADALQVLRCCRCCRCWGCCGAAALRVLQLRVLQCCGCCGVAAGAGSLRVLRVLRVLRC